MYVVFWTAILASFLTVTGMLHALCLPDSSGGEGMALAANFLQYQKAAQRAAAAQKAATQSATQAAPETVQGTGAGTEAEAEAAGSTPDIRPYLPDGYEAAGDWGMTVETTAEGSILYVYGTEGARRKLALADVCKLAKKQTGTGIKQGNVLVPWNMALPGKIPEGAVVMATRIQ